MPFCIFLECLCSLSFQFLFRLNLNRNFLWVLLIWRIRRRKWTLPSINIWLKDTIICLNLVSAAEFGFYFVWVLWFRFWWKSIIFFLSLSPISLTLSSSIIFCTILMLMPFGLFFRWSRLKFKIRLVNNILDLSLHKLGT